MCSYWGYNRPSESIPSSFSALLFWRGLTELETHFFARLVGHQALKISPFLLSKSGIIGMCGHVWLFTCLLKISIQIFTLAQKCSYPLSHLPSPFYFLKKIAIKMLWHYSLLHLMLNEPCDYIIFNALIDLCCCCCCFLVYSPRNNGIYPKYIVFYTIRLVQSTHKSV